MGGEGWMIWEGGRGWVLMLGDVDLAGERGCVCSGVRRASGRDG